MRSDLPHLRVHSDPLLVLSLLVLSLFVLSLFVAGAPAARVQPDEGSRVEVLFMLTQYTSWTGPLSLRDEVAVCVLGRDPFRSSLDALVGRASRGRRVVVRRFLEATSAHGCHVVYVSASESGRLSAVLPVLHRAGALTVSEIPRFAHRGGMVRLFPEADWVGLEVNVAALRVGRVTLSSRVLRLARIVGT